MSWRAAAAGALFLACLQQADAAPRRESTMPGRERTRPAAQRLDRGTNGQQFGLGGGSKDVPLTAQFDRDGNGRLDASERQAAREYSENLGLSRRGRRLAYDATPAPGEAFPPERARPYPQSPFYDEGTLRTLFLSFENDDWERELMAFKSTDVDVPATLVVDGRTYGDVGIQFHGNSSFMGVPLGLKHSMRIALDWIDKRQGIGGINTLLLLNAHEDPSFLRTVLTMQIAREYGPAPRANLVRVVINGESWGIYVNQQPFNNAWSRDWFGTDSGARWRVEVGGGVPTGLTYLGEEVSSYRSVYDLRSKEDPAAWEALIGLTRTLNETPAERLEGQLATRLDIDGVLRFLAIENVLVNHDGYWTRGDDYNLFRKPGGQIVPILYDVNGTFVSDESSLTHDPLYGLHLQARPLISRLLAVPSLRQRYLGYVREIATDWLDWNRLGPHVERYRALIDADVRVDTRKLYSYDAFSAAAEDLRFFADRRRAFLLGTLTR
jgi:hypothetical protein